MDYSSFSDEELMIEFQKGNKAAFAELYGRHKKGRLYRYLLRNCNNESDAEDLFSGVWEKLYKTKSKFKVNASFKAFLFTTARNHLIDCGRKKKTREGINQANPGYMEEDIVAGGNCQPEQQAEMEEQYQMLLKCIDALPAKLHEAFRLREDGGCSIDEIAYVLKIKKETAKSRLRYAFDKLRKCLHPDE